MSDVAPLPSLPRPVRDPGRDPGRVPPHAGTSSPPSYLAASLRPFAGLLGDPAVTEVAVNPDGRIWVEAKGDVAMRPVAGLSMDPSSSSDLAQAIATECGAKLGDRSPLVSGKIAHDGRPLRAQVAIPPATEVGGAITLRAFGAGTLDGFAPTYLFDEPVSLDRRRRTAMEEVRAVAATDLAGALERIVALRLNVVVSGGTSTGKTTLARHVLSHVDPGERLVTIEDALELFPEQRNTVGLIAERREDSPRTAQTLLEATLRMRPDRIVLGELRGREALTYLEAINTGHGGSVTTIHAETAALAVDRLALLALQAGTPLTYAEVMGYVARSIDVVVQLGRHQGRRGVTELYFPSAALEDRS